MLFLHGLESGPHGHKSHYLQAAHGAVCPDMHMSLWRLDKFNSLPWSLWSCLRRDPVASLTSGRWMNNAVRCSLDNCTDVASRTLTEKHEDIVCGSSWGGAVAINLLLTRTWTSGPTLLLAPAWKRAVTAGLGEEDAKRVMDEFYERFVEQVDERTRSRILIVHGDQDEQIPIHDSQEFCARVPGPRLVVVPGGDHSLNEHLLDQKHLSEYVEELVKRAKY